MNLILWIQISSDYIYEKKKISSASTYVLKDKIIVKFKLNDFNSNSNKFRLQDQRVAQ
jgi:hypothetical protein